MTALVCGSFAYDTIMVFQDQFKNHILPDKVHKLNVAFLVPDMRREFGGCAGNIIYNLQLLEGNGLAMGTVGNDFTPYANWMDQLKINRDLIKEMDNSYTAQAFITTDLDDNQITAFHPGAMNFAHSESIPTDKGITLGMISPDGKEGMVQHASEFTEAEIPFFFDPGQGLPMFDREELLQFIDQATWITVNDYEGEMIADKTGLSLQEISERVEALIVTLGGSGSKIYTQGEIIDIPAAKATQLSDPTGCGDAYRAGLIYGIMNKMDWAITGRIASLMGAIKMASHGTQNHRFTLTEFKQEFNAQFGISMEG